MTRKRLTVTYERQRNGTWHATVAEIDQFHGQGRSLSHARARVLEGIDERELSRNIQLHEVVRVDARVDADIAKLNEKRDHALRLGREITADVHRVAVGLARSGMSRRDVGQLLGLSFQRVQQIVRTKG